MFKNIWLWLTNALSKIAKVAVEVVNVIKGWVYSPVLDVITALTNSKVDDNILAILRDNLPRVLNGILVGENVIGDLSNMNFESLLKEFKRWMGLISKDARGKWWTELAAIIANLISSTQYGKPLAMSYAKELTQKVYRKSY